MASKHSLGDQFNQQYEEAIELVQSRAIWRVGEKIEEGEAFRCRCTNCGYESLHQQFQITRHRLLFGKSITAIEAPRPMLWCRRCSQQSHLRDVGELVVPSTMALADSVRREAAALAGKDASTTSADDLLAAVAALNDEASGPVRRLVFDDVIATLGSRRADLLREIGAALFLGKDQIASAISAVG